MERTYLPTGTIVASYRIVRVVGAGGFGVTYEAEHIKLGTSVAIKEYFPEEFATRGSALEVHPSSERHAQTFSWGRSGFEQEAQTLARFRHPSVVQIFDVFEANGTAYMAMAFEQGQSLEQWLRSLGRPPSQEELDHILHPLLDALEMMHHENFLHRDIAPDNIIIRRDMTPVLLDFGAARKTIAARTHALTGLVKSGYSPAEQYSMDGKHQGPWTDLYALGATLYRAVTGRVPEEAPSRVLTDTQPPAGRAAAGHYRSAFMAAIDMCLRPRPADRPQSVPQARDLLYAQPTGAVAAAMTHVATTAARPLEPSARPTRDWRQFAPQASVIAVVVSAIAGLAYIQWGSRREPLAVPKEGPTQVALRRPEPERNPSRSQRDQAQDEALERSLPGNTFLLRQRESQVLDDTVAMRGGAVLDDRGNRVATIRAQIRDTASLGGYLIDYRGKEIGVRTASSTVRLDFSARTIQFLNVDVVMALKDLPPYIRR